MKGEKLIDRLARIHKWRERRKAKRKATMSNGFVGSFGLLREQAIENYRAYKAGIEPLRFDVLKICGLSSFEELDKALAA